MQSFPESLELIQNVLCLYDLQVVDDCIFIFFVLEMCIKCIPMGIVGTGAFLVDKWNWLDCFIVYCMVWYCIVYCFIAW